MHLSSSLLLVAAALFALPDGTFECATNGLCGYQPSCAAYSQPRPSCGCASSYGCGSYGCYRLRARGAKSYQPKRGRSRVTVGGSSSEEAREVLRQRMAMERVRRKEQLTSSEELDLVSPSVLRNSKSEQPINPDRAFYECCIDRKLPDACLSKCSFGAFTKPTLQAMYFKQDPCPLDAMKEMQFCAAQGRDHRDCCARNGVTTTLAGPKCLSFCDQRLGRNQQLDMSYVPCFDRFESMKSCFWHDMTRYYKRV
ncbi:DB domain-containing protein [Caenorhabditis elegans]|uniref:Domain of unknown function DB domain-containing protein n=1 Tax=Caenorhabditis elegans TaxID=6239 RepID=O62261_CAEEL|nr:protein of unknown function DB domain-containing protein [Caenorhabditis elegans]CAB04461.1 Domain of unknown function DB domain-containing protein [Caenorhabditis elegans]|eukprot:NP_507997.1 Uncharacterized protein CELE_F53F8.4 [Caenorhabditis elegans]